MSEPFAFDSLSQKQIDALGSVAFGAGGQGAHDFNLKSLVRRGLIEPVRCEERSPEFGGVTMVWTTYTMPLPVHIAFCEWCSKQPEDVR